jgi:hypothetical protein
MGSSRKSDLGRIGEHIFEVAADRLKAGSPDVGVGL